MHSTLLVHVAVPLLLPSSRVPIRSTSAPMFLPSFPSEAVASVLLLLGIKQRNPHKCFFPQLTKNKTKPAPLARRARRQRPAMVQDKEALALCCALAGGLVPGVRDLPGADLVSSTAGLCTRVAGDRALGFWISVLTPVCHHGESCRLCHCLYCFFPPSGDAHAVQNQNLKVFFALKRIQ